MNTEQIKIVEPSQRIRSHFDVYSVACLVVTKDKKFLFQHRDSHCVRYPNCLGPFGGRMEENEKPFDALVRELHEELGAKVDLDCVIELETIVKPYAKRQELIFNYIWEDVRGTITGCYEGKAVGFSDRESVLNYPNVMEDTKWLLDRYPS